MSDLEASGGRDADPAYIQIADDIAARIGSGELRQGDRLLSKRALADYYGRSDQTVRHAMEVLRELIVTIHGRGTSSQSTNPSPVTFLPLR